jgi:hypothetical protein
MRQSLEPDATSEIKKTDQPIALATLSTTNTRLASSANHFYQDFSIFFKVMLHNNIHCSYEFLYRAE